ncbi:hypothetical protein BRADI_5g15242v3, partial [Brachypodium distachyon]
MINAEHACVHGGDFAGIFVLAKVEALRHVPHHLSFHKINGLGAYADVYINEVWDVARMLGHPVVPPRPDIPPPPLSRRDSPPWPGPHSCSRGAARVNQNGTALLGRAYRAYQHPHATSFSDFMAMPRMSAKPKFKLPSKAALLSVFEFTPNSETDGHLKAQLLACDSPAPHAATTFDPTTCKFSFEVLLSPGRTIVGEIMSNVPLRLFGRVGPTLSLDPTSDASSAIHPAFAQLQAHLALTTAPICTLPPLFPPTSPVAPAFVIVLDDSDDSPAETAASARASQPPVALAAPPAPAPPLAVTAATPPTPPVLAATASTPPTPLAPAVTTCTTDNRHLRRHHPYSAVAGRSCSTPSFTKSSTKSKKMKNSKEIASILNLPLASMPAPTEKSKILALAEICDLDADSIISEAEAM